MTLDLNTVNRIKAEALREAASKERAKSAEATNMETRYIFEIVAERMEVRADEVDPDDAD